jgi:hypothetical protein
VGPEEGAVWQTNAGLPVVAFTHVADCRAGEASASEAAGIDCSGPRAGNLYVQYWFYYVDSATAEGTGLGKEAFKALGRPTAHPDDCGAKLPIGATGGSSLECLGLKV